MKYILLLLLLSYSRVVFAQEIKKYPNEVNAVLEKAGNNRGELEKVIAYYKKSGDPLKLKSAYFLIANMDIHYSADYVWMDPKGKKVEFDELMYTDFSKAVSAFEEIKKRTPGIYPIAVHRPDINYIKAEFLIDNIENSFKAWKKGWAKSIPFADFCEYILPYRASIEPLQNWRTIYTEKFGWIDKMAKSKKISEILNYIATDERNWFTDTWGIEDRKEPLPRLGALQLLLRKRGPCEDITDLEVFTMRSQGIPITLDEIPYWATATDGHFLNTVFDGQMRPINYDAMKTPPLNNPLGREPSKVIRITYARQPNLLAGFEQSKNIPEGFMRTLNYIDVTNSYWQTTTISCNLIPQSNHPNIAFACVFNGLHWRAAWWGKINNDVVRFTNMSKGAVFLPAYYVDGKIKAAGYPVAEGYNHEIILKPDLNHKMPIVINEEDKYLLFQQGKKYRLYYWDNNWHLCGTQIAAPFAKTMLFANVPKNALLLLLPEYSVGKERPFMITDDGKRVWW